MKEEKIPSLTEKIRIFALGGLDEDGKNLFCVEVDESIYVIEAGIKFPDNKESLGIEFIIQDFTYLVENKIRTLFPFKLFSNRTLWVLSDNVASVIP